MAKQGPRIPYIQRDEWNDDTLDVFTGMERDEAGKERARQHGSKMNIINVLAHHPRIVVPYLEMNKALFDVRISMREREIAVLRLSHLSNSEYEWFQHVEIGKRAGLTDADIEAIRNGLAAEGWSEADTLVMNAVDELEATDTVSDLLWAKLSRHFDREQLLELLFVIGAYKMTAWILNAVEVPAEESIQH